jgi:hypothetical protein
VTRRNSRLFATGALAGFLSWCLITVSILCTNTAFVDTAAGWIAVALVAGVIGACSSFIPMPGRLLNWIRAIVGLGAALVLGVTLAVRAPAMETGAGGANSQMPAPILVLGLDGATWNVLGPLIKTGETPNLARLIREGASGELASLDPMVSPRLWATIDTGVRPEKHGIVSFFSTQADLRVWRVWEWLAVHRRVSVGLLEWYLTWPPPPAARWAVPGLLAPDERTQPPRLGFLATVAGAARRYVTRRRGSRHATLNHA